MEDDVVPQELIDQAEVEVLDARAGDEESFLAAGQRVADLADVMIAVWDGAPAKGLGDPITRQITWF